MATSSSSSASATPRRRASPRRGAPEPWTGVRDAVERGPTAPQLPARVAAVTGPSPDDGTPQDEDCLRVDVRAPAAALADGVPRPVLVWLHGGAYVIGSAATSWYDTARLVAEGDVVTVNVGYRLGVLGWLAAPGVSDGNLGLLDQIAALRWVRDRIAAFGGDADQVTVMGQSAGAHSIACLMTVPEARPLFRRAILQSGQLGLGLSSPQRAARVAGYVTEGLEGADPATAEVEDLLAAQRHAMIRAAGPGRPRLVAGLRAGRRRPAAGGRCHLGRRGVGGSRRARRVDRRRGRDVRAHQPGPVGAQAAPGARAAHLGGRRAGDAAGVRGAGRAVRGRRGPRLVPGPSATASPGVRPRPGSGRATASSCRSCSGRATPGRARRCSRGADWDADVEPLGAVMRAAWLRFVRTGNPATDALPWPPHAAGGGPTVVLDASVARNGHTR